MDLSIIIVNYRGWDTLAGCLEEIAKYSRRDFDFEVIIVDNNSADGRLESFRSGYPDNFRFVLNSVNGGFANGCNLGESVAQGNYLLFLNPDTVAPENAVSELLKRAKSNAGCRILSCRQLYDNGKESRAWGEFLRPGRLTGPGRALTKLVRPGKEAEPVSRNMFTPDWISGSVMMISHSLFREIGRFDDDYWMYYEDMDFCRRAADRGGRICYFTDAAISHRHGGSSRINTRTTALTKTEVLISQHVYIEKHFRGAERRISHLFMIFYNLVSYLIPAATGIILFFIPVLRVRSLMFGRIAGYYAGVISGKDWISPRSVNRRKL